MEINFLLDLALDFNLKAIFLIFNLPFLSKCHNFLDFNISF